jgi:hypothetical protein
MSGALAPDPECPRVLAHRADLETQPIPAALTSGGGRAQG